MKLRYLVCLLALSLALVACDSDDADDAPDDEATAEESVEQDDPGVDDAAQEMAGQPAELADVEGPFDGAHDPDEPIEAADFPEAMASGVCLAYDNCLNEELKSMVFSMLVMGAAMTASTEGDEETEARLEAMMEEMQASGELIADREACDEVMGLTLDAQRLNAETIEAGMEAGRVEYDPEQAARCVSRFGEPFDLCREERAASPEPDAQDFMASMGAHQNNLVEHFSVCDDVFIGQVEDGEECFGDMECADGQCIMEGDEESGECGEPEMQDPGMMPGGGAPGGQPGGQPAPGGMPGMQ